MMCIADTCDELLSCSKNDKYRRSFVKAMLIHY